MAVRSPAINVMVTAATKVARALNRDFGEIEQLQTSRSGSWDFTNRSFQHGARILLDSLTNARPKSQTTIAGSPAATPSQSTELWMANPISGKTNFAHGIPHFAVSIAYVVGLQTKSAIVYDFINDNLYWAEKGDGAYRNDRRIRVSKRQNMGDLVIGNLEAESNSGGCETARANLARAGGDVRILGSLALDLAFVASGVFDGFWSLSAQPSEFCSGQLLIAEAGGFTSVGISNNQKDVAGSGILASNGVVNTSLTNILGLR